MSGRGTAPHCGQILRPGQKAIRHVGRAVWKHCEMSAYRMGPDLRCGPTRARHTGRPRRRRGPTMHRVSIGHKIGVRAHAGACGRRNAETGR
ncbi:UNVERIFIED_CONTAM: hypothetical protein Sradi_5716800 [Sesamum radiatum]|uniref:Uncharacterized protein n=1 Tax=Sesamum radiatum TaxID=300843 RepID=A0AAW2L1Q6_SESRA